MAVCVSACGFLTRSVTVVMSPKRRAVAQEWGGQVVEWSRGEVKEMLHQLAQYDNKQLCPKHIGLRLFTKHDAEVRHDPL